MADSHACAGIAHDISDFIGLEVPVDRNRIGPERHDGIGRLQKRNVVAHQDSHAIALLDAKRREPARNQARPLVDLIARFTAVTADDPRLTFNRS
jgi:hypothetical protein